MFGGNSTWGQNTQQQQQPQQGGGLFGGGGTTGGFGSGGGFGSTATPFGQPAQQQPQQSGLFGASAPAQQTSGFGGFGATPARPTFGSAQAPAFGTQPSTGGGLFGSTSNNAFGSSAANTGSTFGAPAQPQTGGGLFGGTNTGGGFGASTSTFGSTGSGGLFGAKPGGFGAAPGAPAPGEVPAQGTASPPWSQTSGYDETSETTKAQTRNDWFQTITAMPAYSTASLEELRLKDYEQGRKGPSNQPAQNAFGAAPATGFGTAPASGSTFGAPAAGGSSLFGGGASTSTFGAPKPAGGLFGSTAPSTGFGQPAQPASSGGLFGGGSTGGFGQPAQPASTGFGGFGQTQQQQPKPAFGGFGATPAPATNAFGQPQQPAASTSTFGGFGQPAQPAAQPTSTFGGFGQPQQQQQPATGGGLFGSSAPSTGGLFGQPAKPAGTGLFGAAPAAAPATGGGLFGSSQPASSGLFGSQPPQQQQQQQQPAQTGGGLFGSSNTTGGGLFGQPPQQQQPQQQSGGLFGGGGGLFGAKPASPAPSGGLFGSQPAQQPAQTGGGLFGSNTSGGLFGSTVNNNAGQQGSSLFGAKPAGSMFGNTTPTSGGLFGQPQQQQQQQQQQPQQNLMASVDQNPYGRNPLFDQPGPALPLAHEIPEKKAPLPVLSGRGRTPTSAKNLTRLRGFAQSPSHSFGSIGGSPGLNGSGRASPARTSGFSGLSDDTSIALSPHAFVARNSVKKLVLDRKIDSSELLGSRNDAGSPGFLASSTTEKPKVSFDASPRYASFQNDDYTHILTPGRKPAAFSASGGPVDTPSKVLQRGPIPVSLASSTGSNGSPAGAFSSSVARRSTPASPAEVAAPLQPGDYYANPDIDTLVRSAYADLTALPNFTVGRKGYGSVTFLEPVDLTTVPSIRDILGVFVIFEEKMCEVYPEDVDKAPRGTGLNVPAEITLEKCWPVDKATREPIKDLAHPRMKQHLRILKNQPETEFVDYKPETGTWVFKVEHFSRYGLLGSDDEEDDDDDERQAKTTSASRSTGAKPPAAAGSAAIASRKRGVLDSDDDDEDAPPVTRGGLDYSDKDDYDVEMSSTPRSSTHRASSQRHSSDFRSGPRPSYEPAGDESMSATSSLDGVEGQADEEDEFDETTSEADELRTSDGGYTSRENSPEGSMHISELDERERSVSAAAPERATAAWGSVLGVEPRKVQVMQASFFRSGGGGEERAGVDTTPKPAKFSSVARKHMLMESGREQTPEGGRTTSRLQATQPRISFEDMTVAPLSRPSDKYTRISERDTLIKGNEGVLADAGLMLGRSFRVGWGPDGTLVHMGKLCGLGQSSSPAPGSSIKLEKLQIFSNDANTEDARTRRLLDVQIANTLIELDEGIPVATPDSTLRFNHFAPSFSADDQSAEAQLWRLGSALFDEIDLGLPETAPPALVDRVSRIRRKLAVSKWLQSAVTPAVDHDLLDSQGASGPARVFTLLTGNQIARAAQAALDAGDLRLATLVARIGGNQQFRDDVFLQLDKWREHRVDACISAEYRKVYCLLAGIVDVSEGSKTRDPKETVPDVAIAGGLDWKRAFGLHLWYGSAFDADLADGLRRYEHALGSAHPPAFPLPWYRERPSLVKDAIRWTTVSQPEDALFLLLSLFANTATPLEAALAPANFGPSPLDFRLPWHIYTILGRALKCRDFEDREAVEGDLATGGEDGEEFVGYSASADALTASYAYQLEQLGLWDQAIFVLLHLELPESRQKSIKEVLFRNIGQDNEKEKFVVEKLLVPTEWIAEAKAMTANDANDPYSRYFHLLDAKLYDEASAVVCGDLLPEAILRDDFALVRSLLEPLRNARVSDWTTTGQVALDLVDTLEHLPVLLPEVLAHAEPHHADAAQRDELARLAINLPWVIRLLPGLFKDTSLQSSVVLSDALSKLLRFGGSLQAAKWLEAAPTIPHGDYLLESEELSLVQESALDAFRSSLETFA